MADTTPATIGVESEAPEAGAGGIAGVTADEGAGVTVSGVAVVFGAAVGADAVAGVGEGDETGAAGPAAGARVVVGAREGALETASEGVSVEEDIANESISNIAVTISPCPLFVSSHVPNVAPAKTMFPSESAAIAFK